MTLAVTRLERPSSASLAARTPRALDPINHWLASADAGNLIVEAAAELADPRCLPALYALRDSGWEREDVRGGVLEVAIEACERNVSRGEPRSLALHSCAQGPFLNTGPGKREYSRA